MRTTNDGKRFIRLRNMIVAALLVIILTLAGCAGNTAINPEETPIPTATDDVPAAETTQTAAGEPVATAADETDAGGLTETTQTDGTAADSATASPTRTPYAANGSTATAKPTTASTAPTATAAPTASAAPTATVATAKPTATPTATVKPTEKTTDPLFGNFSARDVNGNTVTNSVFAGYEVTMVNIWASYCGPCANEMPDLAALNSEYKSRGFQVVGIIVDAADSSGNVDDSALSDAKSVISKTGADYTHIIPSASMFSKYLNKVSSVPTTVFVNSDGEIIGSAYVGSKSRAKWAAIIEEKLG